MQVELYIFVILISFKISLANIMCTHSEGVLGDLNTDTLNYRWPTNFEVEDSQQVALIVIYE